MSSNQAPETRFGRGMLSIFWLLVLGALFLAFTRWEGKQLNPNQNVHTESDGKSRRVSLERNRYGHYVTVGRVNGQHVVFMLDTGATMVAVPAGVAEQLGLEAGPAYQVQTANGLARAYATTLESVSIGNIVLHDVRAAITPGMQGEQILLGMSVLKELDFNQRGNTLTLEQHL